MNRLRCPCQPILSPPHPQGHGAFGLCPRHVSLVLSGMAAMVSCGLHRLCSTRLLAIGTHQPHALGEGTILQLSACYSASFQCQLLGELMSSALLLFLECTNAKVRYVHPVSLGICPPTPQRLLHPCLWKQVSESLTKDSLALLMKVLSQP